MSVAFTKEGDSEAVAADLPDRPISLHRNWVTAEGLEALETAYLSARDAYAAAQARGDVHTDRTAMARATRDLRYYAARRATAELVVSEPGDQVTFGHTVTVERSGGRTQTFRIVGEDEADPAKGSVSYLSPLARAVMGRSVGDTAVMPNGSVEIVSVSLSFEP